MKDRKIAVVAIGGNSLIKDKQHQTVGDQYEAAKETAQHIAGMIESGWDVVIGHGNGPQVGVTYLRQLAGQKADIPPLNLALCNALTQAEIGTLLELAIINTLNQQNPDSNVLALVSQVEVTADDPAFQNPTKPIGPFLTKEEAEEMKQKFPDWTIVEDSGRGYRRVVPSPVPIKVFASKSIGEMFNSVDVVIAGGGGGIPVVRDKKTNTFTMVDSVIDKDRTAYLIAMAIKATHFFLLTGVPHVSINFGTPEEESLFDITVEEAKKHLIDGQFPAGSMGPKIESAVRFAEDTGGTAIITNEEHIAAALEGTEGTRIHL